MPVAATKRNCLFITSYLTYFRIGLTAKPLYV